MTDRTKTLFIKKNNPNLRYSPSSSNSSENTEIDYNLYCFSQGYKTHEKGYWRGVLRNKYVDFDLRNNKDWNYPVGLEPDFTASKIDTLSKGEAQLFGSKKFPKELMDFVKDNEIGWESGMFQKFKKNQAQTGAKKQKNREWILSNGIKRNAGTVGLRTQNYKQFEENEKNKELKKAYLLNKTKDKPQEEEEYVYKSGKHYDYSDKKPSSEKLDKTFQTATDTRNSLDSYNTLSSSGNINEQKGDFIKSGLKKRIETDFSGRKKDNELSINNLHNLQFYDQYKRPNLVKGERVKSYDIYKTKPGFQSKLLNTIDIDNYRKAIDETNYRKTTPKGLEKSTGFDTTDSSKRYGQKLKFGPKGTGTDSLQKSETYVKGKLDKYLPTPKGLEKSTGYGSYSTKKDRKDIKYGQKDSVIISSSKKEGKKSFDEDRKPIYGKTGLSTNVLISSSKKEGKKSFDEDRKPLYGKTGLSTGVLISSTQKEGKKYDKEEGKPLISSIGLNANEIISNIKNQIFGVEQKPLISKSDLTTSKIRSSGKKQRPTSFGKEGKPLFGLTTSEMSKKERKTNLGEDRTPLFGKNVLSTSDIKSSSKKERSISFGEDRTPLFGKSGLSTSKIISGQKEGKTILGKDGKPLFGKSGLTTSIDQKERQISLGKEGKPLFGRGGLYTSEIISGQKEGKTILGKDGKPLFGTSGLTTSIDQKERQISLGKEGKPLFGKSSLSTSEIISGQKEGKTSFFKEGKPLVGTSPLTTSAIISIGQKEGKTTYGKDVKPLIGTSGLTTSEIISSDQKQRKTSFGKDIKPLFETSTLTSSTISSISQKDTKTSYGKDGRHTILGKDGKPLIGASGLTSSEIISKGLTETQAGLGKERRPLYGKSSLTTKETISSGKKQRLTSFGKDSKPLFGTNILTTSEILSSGKKERKTSYGKDGKSLFGESGIISSQKEGKTSFDKEQKPLLPLLGTSVLNTSEIITTGKKERKASYGKGEKPLFGVSKLTTSEIISSGQKGGKKSFGKDSKHLLGVTGLSSSEIIKSGQKERKSSFTKIEKPLIGASGLNANEIINSIKNEVFGVDQKPLSVKKELSPSIIIDSSKKERKTNLGEDRTPLFGKNVLSTSDIKSSSKTERSISFGEDRTPLFGKSGLSTSEIISGQKEGKTILGKDGKPLFGKSGLSTSIDQSKQIKFDRTRQITFGESEPKIDYSKYNKSQTYKDKKIKKKSKVDDGEHKGQKTSHTPKSDYDDILKDLRKQATYDLKELNRETHFGKPGEYEKSLGMKFDKSRRFEKKEEKKRKKKEITKPDERKHEKMQKKKKISYGEDGKTLTNISSLKVPFSNEEELKNIQNYEYEGKSEKKQRYNTLEKTKGIFKPTLTTNKYYKKTQKHKHTPKQNEQISTSFNSYNLAYIPKDKSTLTSKEYQTIDSTKSSYSSIDKKPISSIKTQLHTEMKRYPTTNYLQKSQTKETYQRNKQFGFAPDYQHYSLASKTQKSGFDKDTHIYPTYGISSSQLNTAANTKKTKHGRLNKSVEGNDDYLYKDKEHFGQTNLIEVSDKNKYIPAQKASSLPKKPIIPVKHGHQKYTPSQIQKYDQYKKTHQRQEGGIINKYKTDYPKGYIKTEASYTQKGTRPEDNTKFELSEYLKKTPTKSQKDKKSTTKEDKLEIYEYYPLNKLSQKNKLGQLNEQKDYSTKAKTAKKDKKKSSKIGEEDIYEYNPRNIIDRNKLYGQIKDNKDLYHKRGLSQLTGDEYRKDVIIFNKKEFDDILDKHRKITDELEKLRRDYSEKKFDSIQKKTPSSYQNDVLMTADNAYKPTYNKYQTSSPSADKKVSARSKSIQNNKYGVLISSPIQRGDGMAFFKLKFLTTKEVCEKFWSQIDSGELSASMFEFNRNSGASSRLSNFLSPEKNRGSRISFSNENTEYTAKNSPAGKNRYGKVMNYSVDSYLKNLREKRPSNKSGIN